MVEQQQQILAKSQSNILPFIKGMLLTLIIALVAKALAGLPILSIMGQLVLAILLGMIFSAAFTYPVSYSAGIAFSNKKLLRLGIILLGMRLNLADIYHAGSKVFFIAVINIIFTLIIVYSISKWFGVEKNLGILTACGTAICGAAAVVAIAPQIKANEQDTAIGAATVAVLGTIFTLVYTFLYPILNLTAKGYGVFTGSTLHEIAHVIAAAAPGGAEAVDLAVIVKLTRVALLVPVAIIIGFIAERGKEKSEKRKKSFSSLPIPWFIFGFLAVSGINTLGIVPSSVAQTIVTISYLLIAMAMAGLGLNVNLQAFRRFGFKSFLAGLAGSVLLSALGYALVFAFHLN
ncbi:YeiH family protein [Neobacillus sp. SM06]|uniref:YeiH family protein n=1 Tax=Neobacillus sp. SM06 TaxID=3422492 RepID=UPI003D2DCBEA